jgi:hypothetical protein
MTTKLAPTATGKTEIVGATPMKRRRKPMLSAWFYQGLMLIPAALIYADIVGYVAGMDFPWVHTLDNAAYLVILWCAQREASR